MAEKSILITGGASGIALETTKLLAATGAYITILDQNEAAGTNVAKELQGVGHHIQFVKGDVTNWDSQVDAFKEAIKFSPSQTLDIVIAAAGTQDQCRLVTDALSQPPSLVNDPSEPSLKVVDVNLKGLFYSAWLACHYFPINSPPIEEGKPLSKSLVLIGSMAGYGDYHNARTPYWASKWGVRGIFQGIRHDVKRAGARINLIAPYFVKTPLVLDHNADVLGGWTDIADVAAAIFKCATDESVDGRAFGILPPHIGTVDFGDDREGAWGGMELPKVSQKLRASMKTTVAR